MLLIYVDNVLILYNEDSSLEFIYRKLQKTFDVKDLGESSYLLGIEITREDNRIKLSQSSYINELLRRFRMEDANEISTPIELGAKLPGKVEESAVGDDSRPYRELVEPWGIWHRPQDPTSPSR